MILKKNLHPAQVNGKKYDIQQPMIPVKVRTHFQDTVLLCQVKNAVASPAGTTIAGILALEGGGMRASMIGAVKAAVDKATELRQS